MVIQKKQFDLVKKDFDWNWKNISLEVWKLAQNSDSSVILKFWDNNLLFTVCMEKNPDPDKDFMPLTIDFREKYSASGRIAWAVYMRREWRPTVDNILYARMTDRSLRPMFTKWMINDTVVSITPLALDWDIELDSMVIVWSSLAVMLAWIPFDWPVWAVQISYLDWNFIVNPSKDEIEKWLFNLLVSGKKWSINMIECWAKEVPEKILKEAMLIAQQQIDKICDIQSEFLSNFNIKQQKITINKPSDLLLWYISNILNEEKLQDLVWLSESDFHKRYSEFEQMVIEVSDEKLQDDEEVEFTQNKLKMWVFSVVKNFIRNRTLKTWDRIDNRKEFEIRPLYCEVWLFKRTHWTWLFWRGATQVFNTATLWWAKDYLLFDDMENDWKKERYFHHYNFPPFSTWDARSVRWVNRREIWHWKLAEKALLPVLPSKEEFPYSIRTVSECFWSWWSTSMASVCASTLSLMDAWVPIKKLVAWIATWLFSEHDENWNISKYMILTDLQWTEDFVWDMDFKVAWTEDWITAIQLDTKLKWLTMEIVHETISRAIKTNDEILNFMSETISNPRANVSKYAPKIEVIKVPIDKVKDVIWKWWEMINKIIDLTWVKIDFEDDWTCFITHQDSDQIEKAVKMVEDITREIEVWQEFDWNIIRVEDYWVFVSFAWWKSWLAHVSTLWIHWSVKNSFKVWDKIKIKVVWIDDKWRINIKKI